jgi:hypothetical protein
MIGIFGDGYANQNLVLKKYLASKQLYHVLRELTALKLILLIFTVTINFQDRHHRPLGHHSGTTLDWETVLSSLYRKKYAKDNPEAYRGRIVDGM